MGSDIILCMALIASFAFVIQFLLIPNGIYIYQGDRKVSEGMY